MGIVLTGIGKTLPKFEVANSILETMVDTDNEWIVSRTGIESRHIATDESGVDLACSASRGAMGWTEEGWCPQKVTPDSIDLVIVATITPDALVPSMAALIKKELGLENAVAFDINAACTGFIYGLLVAQSVIHTSIDLPQNNRMRRALVIGVERMSRITDWTDRGTCILFGDGAGAAIIEHNPDSAGILGIYVKNYDDNKEVLSCGMSFDAIPFADDSAAAPQHILMQGQQVFKFAANAVADSLTQVLEQTGIVLDDIKRIVPHQANERIIKYAAQKLGLPMDRFQISMHDTGNVSAASIPMALCDQFLEGDLEPGDKIALVGFGGGLTAGAAIIEIS
ncbi:MAG: beta-ketoacyl-ACP synthase 3 [Raoultibacter sp.]